MPFAVCPIEVDLHVLLIHLTLPVGGLLHVRNRAARIESAGGSPAESVKSRILNRRRLLEYTTVVTTDLN